MALRSIVYRGNELKIINQLLLPGELKYEEIKSTEDAFKAIKEMQIRGEYCSCFLVCWKNNLIIDLVTLNELYISPHILYQTRSFLMKM